MKRLRERGHIQSKMTAAIVRASFEVLDAFNNVRNNHSLARDNPTLDRTEAMLIVHHVAGRCGFCGRWRNGSPQRRKLRTRRLRSRSTWTMTFRSDAGRLRCRRCGGSKWLRPPNARPLELESMRDLAQPPDEFVRDVPPTEPLAEIFRRVLGHHQHGACLEHRPHHAPQSHEVLGSERFVDVAPVVEHRERRAFECAAQGVGPDSGEHFAAHCVRVATIDADAPRHPPAARRAKVMLAKSATSPTLALTTAPPTRR